MKPTQISNTAAFIAVKFYGLTKRKEFRSLFEPEVIQFYDDLVRQLPAPIGWYHAILKKKWARRFFTFWEELLLPGDLMHILMRKWYLQNMIAKLHKDGCRQLVVPGAGFDHLAFINARRGMKALELDVPRMMEEKRSFICRQTGDMTDLNFVGTMFEPQALLSLLYKSSISPNQKTVVVAEGFFDYFDSTAAKSILGELNTYFKAGYALCSTIFSLHELSGFRSFIYRQSIRLSGEQLKLGLDKDGFQQLLEHQGLSVNQSVSYQQMQKELLEPKKTEFPVLPGFYLLQATHKPETFEKL